MHNSTHTHENSYLIIYFYAYDNMLIIIKALFYTVRNIQNLLGRQIKGSIVVSLAIDHLDLNVSVVVHKILPVLLEAISRATLHKNSSVQERHEETNGEKDGKEGARRTFRIMDHVCGASRVFETTGVYFQMP